MLLEYEIELVDLTEARVRYYLRSSDFKKRRLYRSFATPLILLGAACFILKDSESNLPFLLSLLVAVVLGVILFLTRKYLVRQAASKYIKREYKEEIPATAIYAVDEIKLTLKSMGMEITFLLEHLENVTEDQRYLELSFGKKGLCVIPLRAFDSDSHKSEFIFKVRRQEGSLKSTSPIK